jgi:hypothetical protein
VTVVVRLVQMQVWVQRGLVQVLVWVQVQVVVEKENLKGQDYNMTPFLRDLVPHESEVLACRDAVRV